MKNIPPLQAKIACATIADVAVGIRISPLFYQRLLDTLEDRISLEGLIATPETLCQPETEPARRVDYANSCDTMHLLRASSQPFFSMPLPRLPEGQHHHVSDALKEVWRRAG